VRRRALIVGAGAALGVPLSARAQQPKPLPVVALVFAAAPLAEMAGPDPIYPQARYFVHGLRDLGWIEGRTVVIKRRSAEGDPRRATAIFDGLVARGVDVIVMTGARWVHDAAQQATRTIPIVASFVDDPVATGRIASLARPGGNLTGITSTTGPEFDGKRLQLLQELAPGIARVAFLGMRDSVEQVRAIARPAGVAVIPVQVDVAEQLDAAFATILRERVDALMLAANPVNSVHAGRLVAFAAENKLPAIYAYREVVEAGGLMSYATNANARYRQMAGLTDRFLRGARIGEVAVEQPSKFELLINGRTAKQLGLVIQPLLLAQADEVIE
jgi:putative ABC transport system substrate-binding protein